MSEKEELRKEIIRLTIMLQAAASCAGWHVPDGPWNFNPLVSWNIRKQVEALFSGLGSVEKYMERR